MNPDGPKLTYQPSTTLIVERLLARQNRKNLTALLASEVGLNHGATFGRAFDDYGAQRHSALNSIAASKLRRTRRNSWRVLAYESASFCEEPLRYRTICGWSDGVEPVSENGDGHSVSLQCSEMSLCVDTERQPAYDRHSSLGEVLRHPSRCLFARFARVARTNYGNSWAAQCVHRPADEQYWGGIVDVAEALRILVVE